VGWACMTLHLAGVCRSMHGLRRFASRVKLIKCSAPTEPQPGPGSREELLAQVQALKLEVRSVESKVVHNRPVRLYSCPAPSIASGRANEAFRCVCVRRQEDQHHRVEDTVAC